MLIERNEFRIKFGKMKDAKAVWLEIIKQSKPDDSEVKIGLLTDLTGPAYTLVLEIELKDFEQLGLQMQKCVLKSNSRVTELYRQFAEICESSERILYNVEYHD